MKMQFAAEINSIEDVAARQLCTGCGVCAYVEPNRYRMTDVVHLGRRPVVQSDAPPTTGQGLGVCPGYKLEHTFDKTSPRLVKELTDCWGPVQQVLEGYAVDEEIRLSGSSGGAASALALYCVEQLGMSGVLHIRSDELTPYLNKSTFSRSREEILAATGSRYAPAGACENLQLIEDSPQPCVFVGKPCDVAAVRKACATNPQLAEKIGLTIAFFCAGVPSTEGLLSLLRKLGVRDADSVTSIRFRGNGWPGRFTVQWTGVDGLAQEASLTYEESWGFLQAYRQWRCYICPDHSGEFADIAVGDPWHRNRETCEIGNSLVVARTDLGTRVLEQAKGAGYIHIDRSDPDLLPASQPNLIEGRGALWGRLLMMRLSGIPTPLYSGFFTFRYWIYNLSARDKLRSTLGTLRRIWRKGLLKPVRL